MRKRKYGLVISDWNMEPMTGFDLLKQVRADPELATTPFIMVTAESKTENVIAAKKAGVSNYIVKPFNAQTLKSKIDAVFGDAEAPRQRPEPHHTNSPHHRLRHDAGGGESRRSAPRRPAARARPAPRRGCRRSRTGNRCRRARALEVGAHRIADRQHAA